MTASDASDAAAARLPSSPDAGAATRVWAWAALAVAVAGLTGSLFLSLGMGLKACPLCFYQRTFMMSLVAVLGMGLLTGAGRSARQGVLALPLAAAGLGVALFHVWLEVTSKLECPSGLLGLGSAPQQSLAMFVLVFALLLVDVLRGSQLDTSTWVALIAAVVLGALLAVGSIIANPPPPAPPTSPYAKPADVCRPPFHPQ